jgi:hypothetical protein
MSELYDARTFTPDQLFGALSPEELAAAPAPQDNPLYKFGGNLYAVESVMTSSSRNICVGMGSGDVGQEQQQFRRGLERLLLNYVENETANGDIEPPLQPDELRFFARALWHSIKGKDLFDQPLPYRPHRVEDDDDD